MKQFTIKDFIKYNSPCFVCDKEINLRIANSNLETGQVTTFRPTIKTDHFSVDLPLKHSRSLQIWIFYQSNKIITSDISELSNYLMNNKLHFKIYCDGCFSLVESACLDWNLDKAFVKPVSPALERFIIKDDKNMYQINSYHIENVANKILAGTQLVVNRLDKTTPISPTVLKLPLIPRYRFKTKEKLLNKLKTYVTFS